MGREGGEGGGEEGWRHVWNTLHALLDVKDFIANKSAQEFADLLRYTNLML